jgi:hypothetical protein
MEIIAVDHHRQTGNTRPDEKRGEIAVTVGKIHIADPGDTAYGSRRQTEHQTAGQYGSAPEFALCPRDDCSGNQNRDNYQQNNDIPERYRFRIDQRIERIKF